jgi:dCTP deaminase
MLSGNKIAELVKAGTLVIRPFQESQLNPNSYNLRLSDRLMTYAMHKPAKPYDYMGIDMAKEPIIDEFKIQDNGTWLMPQTLYLGCTEEYTETHPPYIPFIDGRSSVGRLGLQVHLTAGFGDSGFCGHWTLELLSIYPLKIYPHIPICQISYDIAVGEVTPYCSRKYQGQIGPRKSGLWKEFQQEELK